MLNFKQKTVLVTGATRGLGHAISLSFLRAGAYVIGTYRSNQSAADKFLEKAEAENWNLQLAPFDVGAYDQVESFFKSLDEKQVEIDVLVNNSGIRKDAVLAMMSPEDWGDVLTTNLTGTYNMCKFSVKNMMRKRYGRIINICSPMSRMGFAGQSNYAASKAGQEGLTKSLSKEVATRGITVNCVSPGFISTELLSDLDDKTLSSYKSLVPMKRFGEPDDVAQAVMFLASEEASYISGVTLDVSGGL